MMLMINHLSVVNLLKASMGQKAISAMVMMVMRGRAPCG